MSYNGSNVDDWVRTSSGGANPILINQIGNSTLSNPLTGDVHGTNCILFQNDNTYKSFEYFVYADPRSVDHRFNGNTHQSIWCCWRYSMDYAESDNPSLDIGLRANPVIPDYNLGYFLVVGSGGVCICDKHGTPTGGRYQPYRSDASVPRDVFSFVYHAVTQSINNWYAAKLSVEPSGDDQILHAYIGSDINTPGDYGEVTWTEVITFTHKLTGADVCTLGTKQRDVGFDPLSAGKPLFIANGAYAGYGSYAFGKLYIDSLGIKLE